MKTLLGLGLSIVLAATTGACASGSQDDTENGSGAMTAGGAIQTAKVATKNVSPTSNPHCVVQVQWPDIDTGNDTGNATVNTKINLTIGVVKGDDFCKGGTTDDPTSVETATGGFQMAANEEGILSLSILINREGPGEGAKEAGLETFVFDLPTGTPLILDDVVTGRGFDGLKASCTTTLSTGTNASVFDAASAAQVCAAAASSETHTDFFTVEKTGIRLFMPNLTDPKQKEIGLAGVLVPWKDFNGSIAPILKDLVAANTK
jgi:hypothetical protein